MIWFVIAGAMLVFYRFYFAERIPALSLVSVAILTPLLSQGFLIYFAVEQSVGVSLVVAVIVVIGEGYANGSINDNRGTDRNNVA